MPQDYTQVVESFYGALAHHDVHLLTELLDPGIEWTAAENFVYADHSPYVGVDAVLKLILERLSADWDNPRLSAGEILGDGNLVIASGRFLGRFKANGASVDAQFVQVFQFKDGKIAKCQVYADTAQFRESISRIVHSAGT